MREEPIQFGEGGRLFGILTLPDDTPASARRPVFILLNAGLLHRVGPSRLHVRMARELAALGFPSLRFDLAGKGDSPRRPGLTNQQSVAADYAETTAALDARLGESPRVLAGICSGADNVVRLTIQDPRVIGMVLLDPPCPRDRWFRAHQLWDKYATPARYLARARRGLTGVQAPTVPVDGLALRDLPTQEQMRTAVEAIGARDGRVLSVFTQYAVGLEYYNRAGQLGRALAVDRYDEFCAERLWPDVEHTYKLQQHRDRLLAEVRTLALGLAS